MRRFVAYPTLGPDILLMDSDDAGVEAAVLGMHERRDFLEFQLDAEGITDYWIKDTHDGDL